jgi:hypothetical protein
MVWRLNGGGGLGNGDACALADGGFKGAGLGSLGVGLGSGDACAACVNPPS